MARDAVDSGMGGTLTESHADGIDSPADGLLSAATAAGATAAAASSAERPAWPRRIARLPVCRLRHGGIALPVDLRLAGSFASRLVGLLGTRGLPPGGALWIRPCSSIHMLGMRHALEVLFLDAGSRVLELAQAAPGGWLRCRGAASVIEWEPGQAQRFGIGIGDRLDVSVEPGSDRAPQPSRKQT
ncbi:MAG: DUF192 domain-containing protein [Comamonadaceae bacterium]|nr:MAG: DUF192 domain-containing protein [Comamonadaceae bacterium]